MNLVEFFELYGLVSGKDLTDYYGQDFDVTELKKLLDDQVISEHRERLGRKMYRYPYLDVEVSTDGPSRILGVVGRKPGINAKSIREDLKISQGTFEKWEEELLGKGLLARSKSGTSWAYFIADTDREEPADEVPEEAFGLFLGIVTNEFSLDNSIQSLATELETSRVSAKKARDWLVDKGLVSSSGHTFPKGVEEREGYLKKHFPNITEIQLRNLSQG